MRLLFGESFADGLKISCQLRHLPLLAIQMALDSKLPAFPRRLLLMLVQSKRPLNVLSRSSNLALKYLDSGKALLPIRQGPPAQ
jgi:hypothetical protein